MVRKGLREIQTYVDALSMAMFVDSSKEIYVCIRIANPGSDQGVGYIKVIVRK